MSYLFLTKSLIFKPKRLRNGWEHKHGFYVSHDVKSAFSIIESEKNKLLRGGENIKPSQHVINLSIDDLRNRANLYLYQIESSSNNYVECIAALSIIYAMSIVVLGIRLWTYADHNSVRLFLISLIFLGCISFLYLEKIKEGKSLVYGFIEIEQVLIKAMQTNLNR